MANEDCLKVTVIFVSLAIIALSITSLVLIFMVYDDAKKKEPADRTKYIDATVELDVLLTSFGDDDFCVENYDYYHNEGAFKAFDIRMNNIKKVSLALIILNFI